jgi:hypothetical protein
LNHPHTFLSHASFLPNVRSRPLEGHIKEHKYNLNQGLLKKSKLAQHAYEEGHEIYWTEAKVLQIQPNTTCRKHKESAQMSLVNHRSVNPVWTSLPSGLTSLQQKSENYSSIQHRFGRKLCFMLVIYRELVTLVMAYTLIVTLIL